LFQINGAAQGGLNPRPVVFESSTLPYLFNNKIEKTKTTFVGSPELFVAHKASHKLGKDLKENDNYLNFTIKRVALKIFYYLNPRLL
jgi:hypothetical protein